jgi:hypothetical protein
VGHDGSALGLGRLLSRTTPSSGSLARNQNASADIECRWHQALAFQFVKKLRAYPMTPAEFVNAKGISVGCVDRLPTGHFGAHALSPDILYSCP